MKPTEKTKESMIDESSKPHAARKGRPPISHGPGKRAWHTAHEGLKTREELWGSLLFDGIQSDGLGGVIENRRCPACGSTISRRTTALSAVRTLFTITQVCAASLEAISSAGDAAQGIQKQPKPQQASSPNKGEQA